MKQVRVKWLDSTSSDLDWVTLAETKEMDLSPVKITTLGFVVAETDKSITIAQSYNDGEPKQVCSLMTIPKGCITSMTDVY